MIRVSELKLTEAGIKKFILFYSWSQFFSWLAAVLITIAVLTEIAYLFFDDKTIAARPILMGFVCALPAVYLARQARFRIEGPGRLQGAAAIEGRLEAAGFDKTILTPREVVYRKRKFKFLYWEKSYIAIKSEETSIVVTGPYGALLGYRKFLMTSFA